ncbi:MAG: stage II sporulation protein M [Bacteroidota bacterium]
MLQAWRRTRKYFLAAAGIFFFGSIGGALVPLFSRALAADAAKAVEKTLGPLAREVYAAGLAGRIILIWRHNLNASFLVFVAGAIPVLPMLAVFANGIPFGLLGVYWHLSGRLPIHQFVLGVLPHGLLELPAIFLAAALSWRLSLGFWGWLWHRKPSGVLVQAAADVIPLGFMVICLLGAAAVCEVLVSPMFLPIRGS